MGLMDQAQAPQEQPALDQPAPEGTADQGGAQDEQVQDPLLEQMIQGIEAKLPPNVQSMYHAAVLAGMKVLFSDQTHSMLSDKMSSLQGQDVAGPAVDGTVKLIGLITKESQGKLRPAAAIPAGITLLCHILDFAEKSIGTTVDETMLSGAIQQLVPKLLALFGITKDKVAQAVQHSQQGQPDAPAPEAAAAPQPTGIMSQAQGA